MARNIKRVDGVEQVQVDLASRSDTVTYNVDKTSQEAIQAAIEAGGDKVAGVESG